jgi:hypothetical protein
MNIQLVIVLIIFAVAVYFTGRKLVRSIGKKQSSGCAACGPEQVKSVKK